MALHCTYRPSFLHFMRSAAATTFPFVVLFCVLLPSKALTEERFWADVATGLAIGGFDPVSFFAETRPQEGSREHEYVWQGASWRFVNEGNLAAFKRDPEIYAPRFGGLGATALTRGHQAAGNPRNWLIDGGRLYFFYSAQARREWLEMDPQDRAKADEVWTQLKGRPGG